MLCRKLRGRRARAERHGLLYIRVRSMVAPTTSSQVVARLNWRWGRHYCMHVSGRVDELVVGNKNCLDGIERPRFIALGDEGCLHLPTGYDEPTLRVPGTTPTKKCGDRCDGPGRENLAGVSSNTHRPGNIDEERSSLSLGGD
jgi:hypothetical protein